MAPANLTEKNIKNARLKKTISPRHGIRTELTGKNFLQPFLIIRAPVKKRRKGCKTCECHFEGIQKGR